MTDIIRTVQLQDPGSSLITLYELEYASGSFAYFFSGRAEFNGTTLENVRFREWRTEYVVGSEIEYVAIPIEAEGFDISSDGAISRPTLKIANIGTVLTDSIGGLKVQELIGAKLTKRTTLEKYLVGAAGDVGPGLPPVEFPRTVYYIDRIKEKTVVNITFELAAPFDLQGLKLPRRVIVGGACPFRYRKARRSISEANRVGGCDWDRKFIGTTTALYINELDEYVIDSSKFTAWSGTATKDNFYTTTQAGLEQYSTDGLSSVTVSGLNYWQSLTGANTTPEDDDKINWRRVRAYTAYSPGATYYGYKNKKYNQYVLNAGVLWRVKLFSVDTSVITSLQEGAYWTEGDICGKKINSCALRYNAKENLNAGLGGTPSESKATTEHLRFGGFPGVQQRR